MAEEKQLTVAELLARNAKERAERGSGGSEESPRRRRRRSLEDGGVSVAELTGSLSKVDATPAQAKHSNVDIDETAPVIPAPKREGDEEVKAAAAQVAADKEAHAAAGSMAGAAEPDAKSEAAAQREAELAKAEEAKKAEFARKAEEAKKRAAEEKAAAEKQAAADAKEAEDKRILAERRAAATQAPSSDDTTVIAKVKDEPVHKPDAKNDAAPAAGGLAGAVAAEEAASSADAPADAAQADASTGELEAVRDDVADPDEAVEDEGSDKLNPVSVVLLALIGIVLGAVVFKGFEILWGALSRIVVAVMALGVTGIMAGVVHALRTERDRASVILAVVVGLLLTFGPMLLI